jgi:hypothetical protein
MTTSLRISDELRRLTDEVALLEAQRDAARTLFSGATAAAAVAERNWAALFDWVKKNAAGSGPIGQLKLDIGPARNVVAVMNLIERREAPDAAPADAALPQLVCAWCRTLMRDGPVPASHGICAACHAREIEKL